MSKRSGLKSKSPKRNKYNGYKKTCNDDRKDPNDESSVRIWVCSWNMAAKEHFKFKLNDDGTKIPDDDITAKFEQIVPTNYDLYIFGVQEGVSDTFFKYISLYLTEFDVQRITITNKNDKNKKSMNKNSNCFGVHGRGDGSFLSTKFTGIAVYYRRALSSSISLKSSCAVSCGITQGSKGACAVLLKIHSSTIAFLSTHMSSNSTDAKLEHFKILVNKTGDQLGCNGFDLLQQFHHIVWFGDLNYRITALSADNVLQRMALGNLEDIWDADSLNIELKTRKQCAFKRFKEPIPRLDFYPTYKKKPNRQLDFDQNPKELRKLSASSQQSSLSQLDKIYTTKYKEPFYKGGLIQDRIPSFCDRVLHHSMIDVDGLSPEQDQGVLNCVEFSYKKDKCNNYGCIPHHLMGSDHSAIYCGLLLKSPMLFPCPPHELNDQGLPKSYQLKIEDIKILRNSPYHTGSTYAEAPLKTKICFPAPFEIENFKYKHHKPFHYTILQQDLDMYHYILRQIDAESKRRLTRENETKTEKIKTHPLVTPQISDKPEAPLIHDMLDLDDIPVMESKKAVDIDVDILLNIEKTRNKKEKRAKSVATLRSNHRKKKKKYNTSIAEIQDDNPNKRRESAPDTKQRELPSDYIFRSEHSMQIEKEKKDTQDIKGGFTFSFDYNDNHTFNLSPTNEEEDKEKEDSSSSHTHTHTEHIDMNVDETNLDWIQLEDYNDERLTRIKSEPTPHSQQATLHKSIVNDNYFDTNNEDKNDRVPPIPAVITLNDTNDNESNSGLLPRTRSKSMGSYTDDASANPNIKESKSGVNLEEMARNEGLSPIYKDLTEFSKKLTLVSFGPSRRPTNGNIHCVLKVETNDLKGQCCIAFEWASFARNAENTQCAELFHHGIPLYDKTGSPILLKVHYKLSLIDKQIVFDYH